MEQTRLTLEVRLCIDEKRSKDVVKKIDAMVKTIYLLLQLVEQPVYSSLDIAASCLKNPNILLVVVKSHVLY